MLQQLSIEEQLKSINLRLRIFGRAEIKELRRILVAGENIIHCVYGFYQGGSGLLVGTDQRLILIDKRRFYVNIEEMKYTALQEVKVTLQYLQASLHLHDGYKKLSFRSISDARIKKMKDYISEQIWLAKPTKNQAFVRLQESAKPYLSPVWRPHRTALLPRRRLQKFSQPFRPMS